MNIHDAITKNIINNFFKIIFYLWTHYELTQKLQIDRDFFVVETFSQKSLRDQSNDLNQLISDGNNQVKTRFSIQTMILFFGVQPTRKDRTEAFRKPNGTIHSAKRCLFD